MSRSIYPLAELPQEPVEPAKWTAIIPAAGYGSRLGHDQPKILYPVAGRPILSWLLDALDSVCANYVLVVSPSGKNLVEPVAKRRLGDRVRVVVQDSPTGMADAIRIACDATHTPFALVVWGDQATLSNGTVRACAALHEARKNATLTLPTLLKKDPYVDIERDSHDRIARVRQAREGEIDREVGENDCGLFLFSTKTLIAVLNGPSRIERGAHTGESNLLQLLPAFETEPGSVATVRISDPGETLGVNSEEDAATAAKILIARQGSRPQSTTIETKTSTQRRKVSIVVPAYNEEAFIGKLLEKLVGLAMEEVGFEKEIIVVNDGSTDRTPEIVKAISGVRLINQKNQGKGAAVQRGVRESTGEFVLVQDADLEYEPTDIPAMLDALGSSGDTAVFGSRILGAARKHPEQIIFRGRVPGQQLGPWLMNRFLTLQAFILYRRWITDLLTGYKIYPIEFLRRVQVKTAGFETDHELTAKLIRAGYKIREVPVTYTPRSIEEGKKIGPIDGLRAIWTLLYFRFAG